MKKFTKILLAGVVSVFSMGSVSVAADPFAAENFSATLTLTTDYTFRGTTFSDRDPAIQGSFDWGYGAWFVGAWGTSTNPTDDNGIGGTLEVDYYAGWAATVGDFDVMIMPLLYTFPGQKGSEARDDTTFELWTSIGRGLEGLPGEPYVNLEFNYSSEYFDNGDNAYYIRPSVAFTLPQGFGLDFGYGYQDVGGVGGNDFFPDDYGHIDVGITKSVLGFDLDIRYHDNFDADVIGDGFALEDVFVFTVSRSI